MFSISERTSLDGNFYDGISEILSTEPNQRETNETFGKKFSRRFAIITATKILFPFKAPLKHRVPHAFVTFGYGGKMVTVDPRNSSASVIQIDDIKTVLRDPHSVRLIDAVQKFRGPLLVGQTSPHTVRLYIERQIKRIRRYELASESSFNNDVLDCLLMWQLLGLLVQQQGRVTGTDLARLLVENRSAPSEEAQRCHLHRGESCTPTNPSCEATVISQSYALCERRGYDRFTDLLLGGHIHEAIECALQDGLYADAMILARRLLTDEPAKLLEIEEQLLATRLRCDPLVTLLSVAAKHTPINPDSGCWRSHLAIVLANLTSQEAMEFVYDLGKVLAKRDCNSAADFCFLAVSILTGMNPFKIVEACPDSRVSRQHITLI
ncbi:unnamed protein product, partial [Strongylus vulgaris]